MKPTERKVSSEVRPKEDAIAAKAVGGARGSLRASVRDVHVDIGATLLVVFRINGHMTLVADVL